MGKGELRHEMRRRLEALTPDDRAERSRRIVQRLLALPQWRRAHRILLFAPLPGEPDLDQLWGMGELTDKLCLYPRINGESLETVSVSSLDDLASGPWQLRQPTAAGAELAPPDLILVPGLAFSEGGLRLGRGGGFYDRFLKSTSGTTKVGIAFAFQLFANLPAEPHDVSVDLVITD